MLAHGVPWQFALGDAFLKILIFIGIMILSLVSGIFSWYVSITAALLIIGFFIIVDTLPTLLNLSRTFMWMVFSMFIIHISINILAFAFHYRSSGLLHNNNQITPTFADSLYFSITTFTTLGYGDFQPLPEHRLTTSIEALFGMVTMAIGASFIWLWCQENLIDKDTAFFDGYRRHKSTLSISRMRIRTITGKERELPNWRLPPTKDEKYYYDTGRGEWLLVNEDTKVPENSIVMSAYREKGATPPLNLSK